MVDSTSPLLILSSIVWVSAATAASRASVKLTRVLSIALTASGVMLLGVSTPSRVSTSTMPVGVNVANWVLLKTFSPNSMLSLLKPARLVNWRDWRLVFSNALFPRLMSEAGSVTSVRAAASAKAPSGRLLIAYCCSLPSWMVNFWKLAPSAVLSPSASTSSTSVPRTIWVISP